MCWALMGRAFASLRIATKRNYVSAGGAHISLTDLKTIGLLFAAESFKPVKLSPRLCFSSSDTDTITNALDPVSIYSYSLTTSACDINHYTGMYLKCFWPNVKQAQIEPKLEVDWKLQLARAHHGRARSSLVEAAACSKVLKVTGFSGPRQLGLTTTRQMSRSFTELEK